ncbi:MULTISPECIES: hfsB [unclassified Brevundimonas]|jgi:Mrp family chromosome partitioning ATPase|uniref:hfsB n=1 Tax=unclassified Brevundimonas TaxID=2622653 RepID=UPI000CFDFF69|nr:MULTISPECIES: hfsB [unclassified Brevundimonas]PRA34438.1 hfsB [Brevundimonas sp. MYb27]PQZ84138.1 hfsB [Brevundimonas sp. MYb31]PRB17889.1 hfsB [Brevundimonas sp. MYb52]PRB38260.1 hfsB [Brevundimonas sp. MYb46]PRB55959.1 hfsB [Brevundimonas sp. MYb33]
MVDLTTEMAGLWAALGPASAHRGRVIQFVSATSGEGTSTVAREFARLAAVRARKPVWLIDGDLAQQGQLDAIAAEPERFGRLAAPVKASPDGSAFYAVTPPMRGRDGLPVPPARLMTARACLGGRLFVTRFHMELTRAGQRVEPLGEARYWAGLRRHADTVVIDTPAADRSDMAITLAPFIDATILVVAAETTAAGEPVALRDEIDAVGGQIAGVVMNRSTWSPPAILKRLAG